MALRTRVGRCLASVVAVGALAVLAFGAAAASATPPLAVTIESPLAISSGAGPFVASGPAVDAGLVCDSGEVSTVFFSAAGGGPGVNFLVVHRFTCDDGSGTFDLKAQVRLDFKGDNFAWTVVGGTDAYARLRGAGDGAGFPCGDDCVYDVYSGGVHVD